MEVLESGLGDERYAPCPLLREHVAAGRLGRKSGQGFFSYSSGFRRICHRAPEWGIQPYPFSCRIQGTSEAMERGQVRLLLVDDDPSLRKLLSATLDGFDLELEEAASAEEADAAIERQLPDVVVLDIAMPGTDGLELCRRLKAAPRTSESARRPPDRLRRAGRGRGAVRRRRIPAQAVPAARAPRRDRAGRRRPLRPAADARAACRVRGGAAPSLRARPPAPARARARAETARPERVPRDDRRARLGARVEGHRHARALAARPALRERADLGRRARACSTTRARSTATCCTTSGRSASPTRCCSSHGS